MLIAPRGTMPNERTTLAVELLNQFAERTGLTSESPARRYLWTDAFAVCNFLGLSRTTGDERYEKLALRLVDQVHHVLGRYRADDRRTGWISGLPSDEGEAHPTRGGLRIGKSLPERLASEPLDPELEWDRDGQYFHYLTKWAHALDQIARATGRPAFHVWARELIHSALRAFTYGPPGGRRMVWKASTDLSRAQVPSMGQHDPLDGLVTCAMLESTRIDLHCAADPSLALASTDFAQMLESTDLVTSDPLGLGGLLVDACRLVQIEPVNHRLIASLLRAALMGLGEYVTEFDRELPAHRRLAFRELGLAIGLAGLSLFTEDIYLGRLDEHARRSVAKLARYVLLREEIESFWLSSQHRRVSTWTEHADINDVMLATSLMPDGFLRLVSVHVPCLQPSGRTTAAPDT